ncbi:teneurin-2 [Tachysurus ichikawai]
MARPLQVRKLNEFRQGANSGNFTLAELGICEPTAHQNTYCPNLGLLHGYTLSPGSDADSDPEGPISPERAMQLWSTRNVKSRHSSGQSSHENSALTLTDSENENKSDDESEMQKLSFSHSVISYYRLDTDASALPVNMIDDCRSQWF